ncbi:MAG TPA: peptidase inhibitor family I36 protein [Pseudonocardiaceae bacterium]|nr:peptidase inhibitor family I36 protein [Pseudonocardiaceae bacterium]
MAALVPVVLVALPASAHADTVRPHEPCDSGTICNFDLTNFNSTSPYGTEGGLPVDPGYCRPTLISDGFRSSINNTGEDQRAWQNSDCTGSDVLIPAGTSNQDLGFQAYGLGGY